MDSGPTATVPRLWRRRIRGDVSTLAKLPLQQSDEALDALVVGPERVFAEDRLAFRVVQLQVDPVHAVVLALQIGLTDELAAYASARRLRRHVLGLLDRLVVGDPVELIVERQPVIDALLGPAVVVLQVEPRNLRFAPGEPVAVHELADPRLAD